ncbi:MAG TPA: MFS transporter [Nitriliruptorales bacterium]
MTEGRTSYRAALRHPVAGRLWAATAVSTLGDYVAQGALLLLAFERSGGLAIGAAALYAASALPALASGTLAGSWLDQIPRRVALTGLQVAGAGAVAVPLLVDGLAPVFVAAALLGALRAATLAVRAGAMAEAVPDQHRGPVLALLGSTANASEVVGYVTGASITIVVGAGPALMADLITFLVGAAIIASTRFPPPVPRDRRPPVLGGFREILANPVLRMLAPLVAVTAAVGTVPEVLAAVATEDAVAWTPWVMAAGPAGNAIAFALLGRVDEVRRPSVQLVHFVSLALALGVGALVGEPWMLVIVNLLVGAGLAWLLGPQLLFIAQAPAERMAQVTGAMISLLILSEGVGSPLFAAIADRVSVAQAYNAAGFLVLAAALLGWFVMERTPAARALDLPPGALPTFDVWTARSDPEPGGRHAS